MNKYIFALILTLLGWTQIQAQNTDLRSAPDVPKFQVTLEYHQPEGATVTVMLPNGTKVENGGAVTVGTTVALSVVMEPTNKLIAITVFDGQSKLDSIAIPKATLTTEGKYSYAFSHKMDKHAEFAFATGERSTLQVSDLQISWLKQKLSNGIMEILVNPKDKNQFPDVKPWDFKTLYDYTGTGKYEPFDKSKFTHAGDYPITITRPADANYYEFFTADTMHIIGETVEVVYRVESINGGRWKLNAKVGEENFGSGFEVEVGSKIDFTLETESGHHLTKISHIGTGNITDFEGKCVNGVSTYTYTTEAITKASTYQFYVERKKDLIGLKIDNLTQTEGSLKPVTATYVPDNLTGFTVKYSINDEWTTELPKDLKAGFYEVEITREEDLNYTAYTYKGQLQIKAGEPEQPIKPEKIEIVLNTDDLTATSVEVGKPLSTSVLSGGYAMTDDADKTTVVGTFEWKYPETVIKTASEDSYPVVFTPIDLRYATKDTSVKVKAIQYYTVTADASANGKVEIKEANAANKYEAGTTLSLVYTPDAHYKVVANQPTTHKVANDTVITGQFEAIMHKVTIAEPQNGTLTVKNGAEAVKTNTEVAEGTLLNITATPAAGYKLATLTNGANPIRNNSITVESDLNIQATFEALPAEEFVVTVADMANGKLLLLDENGNSVNKGASVKKGTKLTVVAVADKGYELAGDIKVGDTKVSGTYAVTADTKFEASFKKISYRITKTTADVTITVKKDEKEVTAAEIGDVLTISAEVTNTNKRLLSLVVNGKEIANGGTYTVENAVNIVANLVDKAKIQILDLEQVVTYDGNEKQFVIRTIPAGLQGFTVKYDGAEAKPKNAENHGSKVYTVTITRNADDQYQAVNVTGKLTIQAALANHIAPTWNQINNKWTSDDGDVTDESTGKADTDFRDVTLTPKNKNYQKVKFSVAKELDADKKITPTVSSTSTKAAALRATTSTLSVNATGGTVTFWNGTDQVTEVYEGQTIIIKGLPNAGNSSMAVWTVGETVSTGEELTFTVATGDNTISVTFKEKTMPNLEKLKATKDDVEYTGSAILPDITNETNLTGWNIVVKARGLVVETPTEAGTYTVYASRSEDQVYAPVKEQEIGSYTIKPQTLKANAFKIEASAIMKGLSLSASTLSGEAPVAGTFAWVAPETIAEEDAADAKKSQAYAVTFTPDSKNYSASGLSLTATVPFLTAEAAPVRKISFEAADHGTFVVKVNGSEVTSGTQITQGDKVEVSTIADNGYSLDAVKINDRVTTGVYTVGETGDVVVTVTFTKVTEPGTEPENPGGGTVVEPDPIIPTVSNPEVAERTATTAVITWEKVSGATSYKLFLYAKKGDTTPLKTYEFDKDGNLKATGISFTLTELEDGKSYYVETIAYNAFGVELVKKSVELSATPTGIESIAEGSQLYAVKGAVVVVPAEPLQVAIYAVTGQTLFNDEVSYLTQVPAKAGIYVVVIKKGANTITEKIIVR